MWENPLAAGALPRTPLGELTALPQPSVPPDLLAGGDGAGCPLPKNPIPAVSPSGLQPWPFGPCSLPPQIRLPKYAYVMN